MKKNFKVIGIVIVMAVVTLFTASIASANVGGLEVSPDSGNWNYTPAFTVTNVTEEPIEVPWLLDCESRSENVGKPAMANCHNRMGTTILQPGDSLNEGFGEICLTWQLDLLAHGTGYVVDPQGCDDKPTPTPPVTPPAPGCKTHFVCVPVEPTDPLAAQCLIPLGGRVTGAKIGKIKVRFLDTPALEVRKPANISFAVKQNDLVASGEPIELTLSSGESLTLIMTPGITYGDPSFISWGANGCYIGWSSTWVDGKKPEAGPMTIAQTAISTPPCVWVEVLVADHP